MSKKKVLGFNLSFGFFPQCSLHIHASYSISQKLNVPMAPLSEPNAVGIVIAHGEQPVSPARGGAVEHRDCKKTLQRGCYQPL